ncbi:carbon-nitrogen hydrolase family protein [Limobrevibacterium gyesilva]|uniref:Carbon-nitrogen hydrolase family protein n=1 Tax=Limobrevibacterium gyesilva TaxID=2991712 RepID=A0AA41YLR4_9PROT|nr:carbon-nitrogen hydrolase family protein [Limobrevibacterium gyesilva]MCW3476204.1 carbon-nitrogen hydrolase family protein [Limobrevibacterium gyesilva]
MTALRLGLLQWQVGRGGGVAGWAARLDAEVAAAARQGAQLLVMPEYAPLELAAGDAPDLERELRVACDAAVAAVDAARAVARRHGVWLLPGTLPFRDGAAIRNRAPLIAPDGRVAFQDKHVMTRFEAEEWGVEAGAPPAVFETPWGRIGISICFDLEFPMLVRAQVEAGAWLIVAPSCTDTIAGFNRVRIAAAARAMENQCFVAITPTVGAAPWCGTLDVNRGHAAVFGPVDRGFPEDGVLARGALDAAQWVFCDLDPAALAVVRQQGAVRNHLSWPPAPPPCRVVAPE